MNAEDADDVMLATGRYWDTYFGPDQERHETQQEHDELESRVEVRRFSVEALSASVLQLGKQGIALVHGKHAPQPPLGRCVGSQQLSEILWQARNQALHWEEQDFGNRVHDCFKTLAADKGPKFSDYLQRNLALDIVDLLGWHTVADFERDMLTMS
ncbi:MAG: hypothetical protein ACR2FQ_00525 [Pseudonocardiaceae bacterium]